MYLTVWTTIDAPGFHNWPDAPAGRAYLRDRHRHLFKVTAEVAVRHSHRDVEFHDLQDDMRRWWGPEPREWGASSCEAIARDLHQELLRLGYNVIRVGVSEDGESGAILTTERLPTT